MSKKPKSLLETLAEYADDLKVPPPSATHTEPQSIKFVSPTDAPIWKHFTTNSQELVNPINDPVSPVKVMRSNAGYYAGRTFRDDESDGAEHPYDRLSGYFDTKEEVEEIINVLSYLPSLGIQIVDQSTGIEAFGVIRFSEPRKPIKWIIETMDGKQQAVIATSSSIAKHKFMVNNMPIKIGEIKSVKPEFMLK